MNMTTILALLPKIGPAVAALPQFKHLMEELIATFDNSRDQDDLRRAYEAALSDAEDAHADLQALMAKHTA